MSGRAGNAVWWQDECSVQRFGLSLLETEFRRLRRGEPLGGLGLSLDTRLDGDGIDLDSLDRLKLSTSLCSAFEMMHVDEDALARSGTAGELLHALFANMEHEPEVIRFSTSGSRGVPKDCVQPMQNLLRETEHWASLLSGSERLFSLVPAAHIYGFIWTVLLPHRLSLPVIDRPYALAHSLATDMREGDVVIGHPAFWETAGDVHWPSGVTAISSGGPVNRESFARVVSTGSSRGMEIYGSSETGGIGHRMAADQGFTLLPWLERRQEGIFDLENNAVVELPDELAWRGQRAFEVGERVDGAVNVAGHLVRIANVESVIAACPGVEAVRVRMMRPEEGDRLKAFVVAREGATVQELRAWCRSRLPTFACPERFQIGGVLPKTETGKDRDW